MIEKETGSVLGSMETKKRAPVKVDSKSRTFITNKAINEQTTDGSTLSRWYIAKMTGAVEEPIPIEVRDLVIIDVFGM